MKIYDRCFLCSCLILPWWRKPAKLEMYCSDGKKEVPLCNHCEKVVEHYHDAMEALTVLDKDIKDGRKDEEWRRAEED